MAASTRPFEVNDFSGGITDDIYDQDYTRSAEMNNFILGSDRKPKTRFGSVIDDLANPQIPAGVQRISTLINYNNDDKLFIHSSKKFYFRNPSAYSTLTGPTGNDVLSTGDTTNVLAHSQWNRHLFVTSDAFPRPMKIYKDQSGTYRVRTSGLPRLASSPTVTAGAAGANNYIYAFHCEYTYTAGPQTFQDVGATTSVSLVNAAAPDVNAVAITNIPVVSNGATDNWDTTVIKVFIYRTTNNGTSFFKVGEVTNGTTTFNDNTSDTNLITGLPLYTDDGTVDFDPVPLAKFIHVVNNIGYYGWIKDGSQEFPFRIRQSVPGDPDSVPDDFFQDLEDDISGISSIQSIPLVFCKKRIYRLENSFDRFGRGTITPVTISDTAGCVSHLSIVQTKDHCFWAGNDGFYATDGYRVGKISDGNNMRYQRMLEAMSQQNRIYGKFDEIENRVYWGVQFDAGNLDNDSIAALDLRYGVKEKSVFTTWSGTSFRPTAIEFFDGLLYRADTRGYVFVHSSDNKSDPKVDTTMSPSDWAKETIIWTYASIHINFGSTFARKFAPRVLLTAGNLGNTTIQITALNDDEKVTRNLTLIRHRKNFEWASEDFFWGDPECVWNSTGIVEQWRRFPRRGLRFSYIKIIITNGFGIVTNSDSLGLATVSNAANTATLVNAATVDWPADAVDYSISFENDNYTREYLVLSRTDDVLTVLDTDGGLPDGNQKWVLKGFRKDEALHLLSYNIHWFPISPSQQTHETGSLGENV